MEAGEEDSKAEAAEVLRLWPDPTIYKFIANWCGQEYAQVYFPSTVRPAATDKLFASDSLTKARLKP